jgi:hypothetical protein
MEHDKQCCAQEWESTNCNHACAAKAQHDARHDTADEVADTGASWLGSHRQCRGRLPRSTRWLWLQVLLLHCFWRLLLLLLQRHPGPWRLLQAMRLCSCCWLSGLCWLLLCQYWSQLLLRGDTSTAILYGCAVCPGRRASITLLQLLLLLLLMWLMLWLHAYCSLTLRAAADFAATVAATAIFRSSQAAAGTLSTPAGYYWCFAAVLTHECRSTQP